MHTDKRSHAGAVELSKKDPIVLGNIGTAMKVDFLSFVARNGVAGFELKKHEKWTVSDLA